MTKKPSDFSLQLLKEIQLLSSSTKLILVGGAVRDRLLGRDTTDFDLVTQTNPTDFGKLIAEKCGGTSFPLDEENGIVRVTLKDGVHIDLAQLQGKDLEQDLSRRDFSINALALPLESWGEKNWTKSIIDFHQGLDDIKKKSIRAISKNIFKEDPLRLLRAFRLSAQLDFSISKDTFKLIEAQKKLIKKPSPERIREELLQIFSVRHVYPVLLSMEKAGIWDPIVPEVKSLRNTAEGYYGKGGVLKHTLDSIFHFEEIQKTLSGWFGKAAPMIRTHLEEKMGGHQRFAHLKWALFLHDVGKPATAKMREGRLRFFEHEHVGATLVKKMSTRYRWSVDETNRYAKLVKNHMRVGSLAMHPEAKDGAYHRFFRDLEDDAVGMLLVSLADHLSYLTKAQLKKRNSPHELTTKKMIKKYYFEREKVLPPKLLSGHEVMKAFDLKPSPLIGELLRDLTEAQSGGNITTKDQALNFLKTRLTNVQK